MVMKKLRNFLRAIDKRLLEVALFTTILVNGNSSTLQITRSPSTNKAISSQIDNEKTIQKHENLEALVGKELGKWDPWILEFVELDYTPYKSMRENRNGEKKVSFSIVSPQLLEVDSIIGDMYIACYDNEKNLISFALKRNNVRECAESVHHELAHFIWYKIIEKDPRYRGPTKEEIVKYWEKSKEKERNKIWNKKVNTLYNISLISESVNKIGALSFLINEIAKLLEEIRKDVDTLYHVFYPYMEKDPIGKFILEKNLEELQKRNRELFMCSKSVRELEKILESVVDNIYIVVDTAKNISIIESLDNVINSAFTILPYLRGEMISYLNFIDTWIAPKKYGSLLIRDILEGMETKERSIINSSLPDSSKLISLSRLLKEEEQLRVVAKKLQEARKYYYFATTLKEIYFRNKNINEREEKKNIVLLRLSEINEGHEILARMIESLYMLYVNGVVGINRFPLDEEDLEFLSKFEINGKKMFGKAIKTYRRYKVLIETGRYKEAEEVREAFSKQWIRINGEFPEVRKW